MKSDIVYIRELEVETIIGIFDWERERRQIVSIDLDLGFDIRAAAESDDIAAALDYKAISHRVRDFVAAAEFQLVEALAEAVAGIILAEFPVPWLRLRLGKPGAVTGSRDTGVIIERRKSDA
ncbi:MAG: dihydroneopterin aldolase [Gammaproteobacteria bacterium]|nr:dihydroneopterin aldolase [Gammaproteobacteria bacterium]MCY4269077.1 dihydroneopterin aldolase [Gammaproteobacteria bacterium]